MVDFVILNELSLPIGDDETAVIDNIKTFYKLLSELKNEEIKVVRFLKEFNEIEALEGKFLSEFISKIEDKDFKRILLSIFSNSIISIQSPLYSKEEAEELGIDYVEYQYDSKEAKGFGAGDIFGTLVISFLSSETWNTKEVKIKRYEMNEAGDFTEGDITIRHCATLENLNAHDDFFQILKEKKFKVTKEEFWKVKDDLFASIKFCNEIKEQLERIEQDVYDIFLQNLILIEKGVKRPYDWNSSPDSKRTLDEYGDERKFSHSDIGTITFSNHMKSFPRGNRMYFLEKGEFIYIGYIGKHLRIAT